MAEDDTRWLKAHYAPERDSAVIDLWRVNLSMAAIDAYLFCLSDDENQRADKFLLDNIRTTFTRSRCVLRLVIARCLGLPTGSGAREIRFDYGDQGKPLLASPTDKNFYFNLSHSGDMALIAVARGMRVGIDISSLARSTAWQAIAKRSFSSKEQGLLAQLPAAQQEKTFHKIWVQKEAYTKAFGEGYSYGFSKFSVMVDANQGAGLLEDKNNPQSVGDWNINLVNVGTDNVAALAYDGTSDIKIRRWEFCTD